MNTDPLIPSILLTGGLIVVSLVLKAGMARIKLPAVVGFLLLGFLLRMAGDHWGFLNEEMRDVFAFLAEIGVFCLLFRVGLDSDLGGLLRQLRSASLVWLLDVAISGGLSFVACRYLLHMDLIPCLVIATAMTATSVGISLLVWQEKKALKTETGELLLDVAELDDISGILLMALLFALLPVLRGGAGADGATAGAVVKTVAILLGKLAIFGGLCYVFSRFIEKPVSEFLCRINTPTDRMVVVVGVGICMAAAAGALGFSIAIGAVFAGLVFSRDPETVRIEGAFSPIYELFTPFFFIHVGLGTAPGSLHGALVPFLVLLAAATLGKVTAGCSSAFKLGGGGALLVGVSLVPRAEIAMIIVQRAQDMGAWALSSQAFSSVVLVGATTCAVAPIVLNVLFRKWGDTLRQGDGAGGGADDGAGE